MEQVVSLLTAFARYFERCILHTRIRHEYNYYLEWRQVSKRHFPTRSRLSGANAEYNELLVG
jgi:hypothetical protein